MNTLDNVAFSQALSSEMFEMRKRRKRRAKRRC